MSATYARVTPSLPCGNSNASPVQLTRTDGHETRTDGHVDNPDIDDLRPGHRKTLSHSFVENPGLRHDITRLTDIRLELGEEVKGLTHLLVSLGSIGFLPGDPSVEDRLILLDPQIRWSRSAKSLGFGRVVNALSKSRRSVISRASATSFTICPRASKFSLAVSTQDMALLKA